MCPEGARDVDVADLLKGAADDGYREGVLQPSEQVSQPALHTAARSQPAILQTCGSDHRTCGKAAVRRHFSVAAETAKPAGQQR